jgi:hypothetical protein
VQLRQEEDVKYLGLHLDRRLTWYKHIFAKKETTRNYSHQKVLVTRTQVETLHKQKKNLSYIKQYSNKPGLRNTTLGYGFHFQHRNPRTLPIEGFAHDMDSPWYVPSAVIRRDLKTPTAKEEIRRYSSQYSVRLSAHPNDLLVNLMEL